MRSAKRPLSRLSEKFILGVVLILMMTLAGTLAANRLLTQRYYLRQQREYVARIGAQLTRELEDGRDPERAMKSLEEREQVLIVRSQEYQSPDDLADELRESFRQKGLGFQKFWLWEQDYERTVERGSRFRLYGQDKLNYSILVEYLSLDSGFYAIAAIVPGTEGFIEITSRFGFLIYSASICLAIALIWALTRHITTPLERIREFTVRLSAHRYEPLDIRTGDELQQVADSLNEMGRDIEQYRELLEAKNRQMEQLLNDVSHDLKTPVSLIGMYAAGIRDGLDDGTFLDTIIRQNQRMSRLVEDLLRLSRMDQREYAKEALRLDEILMDCIKEQELLFQTSGLTLQIQMEEAEVQGSRELAAQIGSNLLSNAAKYAAGGTVEVTLTKTETGAELLISNEIGGEAPDMERLWEPFYVGEDSRNKELSGTGLGLPMVKRAAERMGGRASCRLDHGRIYIQIDFVT